MKNKRLTEKFGIREGDRVRLSVMRDVQGPDPDGNTSRRFAELFTRYTRILW